MSAADVEMLDHAAPADDCLLISEHCDPTASPPARVARLVSSDGEAFTVPLPIARMSGLLAVLTEDGVCAHSVTRLVVICMQ